MSRIDPGLDQPVTLDVETLDAGATWLLANSEIRFTADAHSDIVDFCWPAAGVLYARRIASRLTVVGGDELIAIVNRYYPGCQETILGSEGLIVSKRLLAPFRSSEERAALWSFECQAEGDYVLRLDVDVEWGEALTQRLVDGLLVAQRNPRAEQGIYKQSNAESTRIFGNPQGPPERVQFDDEAGTAHLIYYVLVNGMVDVTLALTVSDVGEQVAWNAFLGLRDSERAFDGSQRAWEEALKAARIWTPDVRFNHAVQDGKRATWAHLAHLRTGMAPVDREVAHAPVLVESLDALDATQSRNLLAHLRRTAERSGGRIPRLFSARAKDVLPDPGRQIVSTNGAYLDALYRHLRRHFDAALLAEHFEAVTLCSEALIRARRDLLQPASPAELAALGAALRTAQGLATLKRDGANTVRWESEACEFERQAEAAGAARTVTPPPEWTALAGWRMPADRPWGFDDPWTGIALAARAVWNGVGVSMDREVVVLKPAFPAQWEWWALMGLVTPHGALSVVWDGSRLHSTLPLKAGLPVTVHSRIRALKTDELDFDLTFEFVDEGEGAPTRNRFHPRFGAAGA